MQINLTGFLNQKNARIFMTELWELLGSAMENIGGIPAKFVEQKKEEIKRRQVSCRPTCKLFRIKFSFYGLITQKQFEIQPFIRK